MVPEVPFFNHNLLLRFCRPLQWLPVKNTHGLQDEKPRVTRSRSLRRLGKWHLWCWSCRLETSKSDGWNLNFCWTCWRSFCPELDKNCHPWDKESFKVALGTFRNQKQLGCDIFVFVITFAFKNIHVWQYLRKRNFLGRLFILSILSKVIRVCQMLFRCLAGAYNGISKNSEIPAEYATWAKAANCAVSHTIHGIGIFTYMKGWFLWDQCR